MRNVVLILIVCNLFGVLFADQPSQVKGVAPPNIRKFIYVDSLVRIKEAKAIANKSPEKFVNNEEGFGIMEMVDGCHRSINNRYLKITPAPDFTNEEKRAWLNKDVNSPNRLAHPDEYMYVKFEDCKYYYNKYSEMKVYDCKPIPDFSKPDEYWNMSDIFEPIRTSFKQAELCYFVGKAVPVIGACILTGGLFAGWYSSALMSGEVAIGFASAKVTILIVDLIGATVGGAAAQALEDVIIKEPKTDKSHACVTADKQLKTGDALQLLFDPELISGLYGICIDPTKVMPLSDLIAVVRDQIVRTQSTAKRKQIRKVVSDAELKEDAPPTPIEFSTFKTPEFPVAPASTTYVAPQWKK